MIFDAVCKLLKSFLRVAFNLCHFVSTLKATEAKCRQLQTGRPPGSFCLSFNHEPLGNARRSRLFLKARRSSGFHVFASNEAKPG